MATPPVDVSVWLGAAPRSFAPVGARSDDAHVAGEPGETVRPEVLLG